MNTHGKLIVIDGIDGSGKATQSKILVEKIKEFGFEVETMDFPQYSKNFFGKMVRQYLDGKFGRPTEINPYLASMLYAFDRFESKEKINQWLNQGKVVILDRYYTSNFIHQAAKLPEKKMADFISWVEELELKVLKIPKPDLIVYLHVEAEIAYNLIAKRGQGYDGHDTLKHLKEAEKKCLQLSKKLGWLIIECAEKNQIKEIDKIAKIIWQEIKPALD